MAKTRMNKGLIDIQLNTGRQSQINTNLGYDMCEIRKYVREKSIDGAGIGDRLALGIHAGQLGYGKGQVWCVDEHANRHLTVATQDVNPKQDVSCEAETENQAYVRGRRREGNTSYLGIGAVNKRQ
jgi:hypothetical protein